jgi:hypothetical protein
MAAEMVVCGACWLHATRLGEWVFFGAYGQTCERCQQKVTHPNVRYRRDLDGRIRVA